MKDFFERLMEDNIIEADGLIVEDCAKGTEVLDYLKECRNENRNENRNEKVKSAGCPKSGTLTLGETEIHSLKELRSVIHETGNVSILQKAVDGGALYRWLTTHYYEEEAEKIRFLKTSDKNWLQDMAGVLGIPYNPLLGRVHQEDDAYMQRKKKIAEYAGEYGKGMPENVNLVALNQEELAALLDAGQDVIYLCKGEFHIPIGRKGITYKGIANPTIENAFTKELYGKAGIQVIDIELPEKIDEKREKYALEKAVENGYDAFYEGHTPLACKLYSQLHGLLYSNYYDLPSDDKMAFEEYHSKSVARQAIRESLCKTYDAAKALFDKDSNTCAVKDIVIFYTKALQKYYGSFKDTLQEFCEDKGCTDKLDKIEKIIGSCSTFLKKELYEELENSEDYYEMYDFDYFLDQVDLTEFDSSIETNLFLSMLENIFTETKTYGISSNIFEMYMEMEKDVNDKAASLHNVARERFNEFVAGLAEIFEEIGKGLPSSGKNETIGEYLKRAMRKDADH